MRFNLEKRVREIELRQTYPDAESLKVAISTWVERVAEFESGKHDKPEHNSQPAQRMAERRLIELVRYAGRSGLMG